MKTREMKKKKKKQNQENEKENQNKKNGSIASNEHARTLTN